MAQKPPDLDDNLQPVKPPDLDETGNPIDNLIQSKVTAATTAPIAQQPKITAGRGTLFSPQQAQQNWSGIFGYHPEQIRSALESVARPQTLSDIGNLLLPSGIPEIVPRGLKYLMGMKSESELPPVKAPELSVATSELPVIKPPEPSVPTALKIPEPKSGTPIYNTSQFGLKPTSETLPYPLNIVPNRLRPPSTNATVFDALLPESLKRNEQGAARPLTTAVERTPAETVPVAESLSQKLDQHPGFANGDISKPPIESAQSKLIPNDNPAIPQPGTARDINNATAELGSVNQVLSTRAETKPIADLITGAQDEKMKWIAQTEREFASLSQGLKKTDRITLGKLIDGQDIPNVNPVLASKSQQARALLDNIFGMIPEAVTKSGKDVSYFENYLTHLQAQPDDIQSAIKSIFQYHFGNENPLYKLFERKELGTAGSDIGDVIYQKGKGTPSSPFVESRTDRLRNIEYDVNKVFPAYIESIAKVIHDKPAVQQAQKLIASLPEGSNLKELSGWYVKNYTKYDALPGLTDAWRNWASYISRGISRSLLSFNPGLQTLHVARLVGNMWPELGTKYSSIGLAKVATHPINAWFEAANNGLMYNEVRPLQFKTGMQKFDSVGNFFSIADYLDKAIGYHGYKQKFLDAGMSEIEASKRALSETKRVSLTVDPARATKGFAFDSPVLGGALGQLGKQYKQVPTKIVEQYSRIIANFKQNKQAAARLGLGVGALLAARESGLHTFHLGTNIIPDTIWGPFGSAVKKVYSDLNNGDLPQALIDTTLWATPGGQSISRQIKQGPSMFEPSSDVKLKIVNP